MTKKSGEPIKCWHFANADLINNGHEYAGVGVAEPVIRYPKMCKRGYHGSIKVYDALSYTYSEIRAEYIELSGKIIKGTDKLVASNRVCLARLCKECTIEVLKETIEELGLTFTENDELELGLKYVLTDGPKRTVSKVLSRNLKKKMKIK